MPRGSVVCRGDLRQGRWPVGLSVQGDRPVRAGHRGGPDMKLSDLTSADEVKAEVLRNPTVRAEWDLPALAREVASRVLRYRVEHGLSQTELSAKLGVSQPYVARL